MPHTITCVELHADDWARLRDIRLRALIDSPHAYGGTYEIESAFNEDRWRFEFAKQAFVIASLDGVDAAMMYVENLEGDFGATCWIGGCWSDPGYRGIGVMRSLFNYIDNHSSEKGWQRQGLGVWADNLVAINSYKSLGFTFAGEKMLGDTSGKYFHHMVRDVPRD